jgi:putative pyruvate formate lyase activating enzyme
MRLRLDNRRNSHITDGYVLDDYVPAASRLYRTEGPAALEARAEAARKELIRCKACPRECGVNRLAGELGTCNTGRYAIVASAFPHFGEEDCLRGWNGSGTIFFSFCNLRCVFCQNWDISQTGEGQPATPEQIAEIMLELQQIGCHNINFVTPEHVVPQVIEAVAIAVPKGLQIPIVYNTSAYDSLDSLRLLDGLIDIYMPDFKFWKKESARRYLAAPDYPERARAAIEEMHRQVGPLTFGRDGLARRGVLLRHLVMPGMLDETEAILSWVASHLSPDTYVNIMGQYRPEYKVGKPLEPPRSRTHRSEKAAEGKSGRSETKTESPRLRYGEINRRPTSWEMKQAFAIAERLGLRRLDPRFL